MREAGSGHQRHGRTASALLLPEGPASIQLIPVGITDCLHVTSRARIHAFPDYTSSVHLINAFASVVCVDQTTTLLQEAFLARLHKQFNMFWRKQKQHLELDRHRDAAADVTGTKHCGK